MKATWMYAALAVSLGSVAAQPDTQVAVRTAVKPAASFGYLDTDKDARLSRQEAKADWAVAQRFATADVNHDGYLDEDEFKQLSRS